MQVITPLFNLSDLPEDCRALTPCMMNGETVGAFFLSPRRAVTDVFFRAEALMREGRVMILYLDGLSYALYHRAARRFMPFCARTFSCVSARTAYPPLTQPCMASMLTGAWPQTHGIFSRRDHRPRVPSLLRHPGAVLVEADSAPLALEREPVLTLPRAGESVDAAVLRAALPIAAGDAPLLIVHFHGLDDLEHDVGDDEALLADKLHELDDAVRALCAVFRGAAILCADHGVHREDGAGSHGRFDCRDMFVPYGEALL